MSSGRGPGVGLRVLFVIATLDAGGAERQMARRAGILASEGHEVRVIALARTGPTAALLDAAGVPWEVLGKRGKIDPLCFLRLWSRVRAFRPHLVETSMFTAGAYGRLAALLAGAPAIDHSEESTDPWKGPVHQAIDRLLAQGTRRVQAVSKAVIRANTDRGIPRSRLHLRYPEIDAEALRREALAAGPVTPDPYLVVAAQRLEAPKDAATLLRALALVRARGIPARLDLLGDGPEIGPARALAFDLGLSDAVSFLGRLDGPAVPQALARGRLFALSSRWEGFSVALLEAQALGLPCVVAATGGVDEALRPGNGVIVPPGDVEGLARGIERGLRARSSEGPPFAPRERTPAPPGPPKPA